MQRLVYITLGCPIGAQIGLNTRMFRTIARQVAGTVTAIQRVPTMVESQHASYLLDAVQFACAERATDTPGGVDEETACALLALAKAAGMLANVLRLGRWPAGPPASGRAGCRGAIAGDEAA